MVTTTRLYMGLVVWKKETIVFIIGSVLLLIIVKLCLNTKDINQLQHDIMVFINKWVHTEDTPIPQTEIIKYLDSEGVKSYTTINALNALLRKNYIRRGIMPQRNKTYYVMLRWVTWVIRYLTLGLDLVGLRHDKS